MRDRMILFRDQFSLDDCFRCLLSGSVFHGGDPAVAGNWELPVEFFEKYWFLTIDFSLQRTTNRWRRMQGLEEVQPFAEQDQSTTDTPTCAQDSSQITSATPMLSQPSLEPTSRSQPQITINDLSSFLGIELNRDKIMQHTSSGTTPVTTIATHLTTTNKNDTSSSSTSPNALNQLQQQNNLSTNGPASPVSSMQNTSYPSSLSSTSTTKSKSTTSSVENTTGDEMFSPTPIQLTNGYYGMHQYTPRNGVGQKTSRFNAPEQRCTTWDSLIANDNGKYFFSCVTI